MEHDKVVEIVRNWLKKQYPSPAKVMEGVEVDLLVKTFQRLEDKMTIKTRLVVECKRTEDHRDVAIGQCLRYYTDMEGVLTYLAVPEDYQQLKKLEAILEFLDLPIGLMFAYYNGEVRVRRKARGKERLRTVKL